jgi:hypothetical protein
MPKVNLYNWQNPNVGDFVYVAYSPAQFGKVIRVVPNEVRVATEVVMRMPNGKEISKRAGGFKCLRSLHADHARKAEKMAKQIQQLEKQ